MFRGLLLERGTQIRDDMGRLSRGIGILDSTAALVDQMGVGLREAEVEVAARIASVSAQRGRLEVESAKVDAEAALAAEQASQCADAEAKVNATEKAATADLARAEPFLQKVRHHLVALQAVYHFDTRVRCQAEAALGGLDKSSMIELKSFTKPHPDVLAVMQAVHALLARVMMPAVPAARKEWRHVRTMMAKIDHFQTVRVLAPLPPVTCVTRVLRGVRQALRSFKDKIDAQEVPSQNFEAVRPFLKSPRFTHDAIVSKSRAAGGICSWVANIVAYYDIFCEVHPKRLLVARARGQLEAAQMRLGEVSSMVRPELGHDVCNQCCPPLRTV